MQAHHAMHMQDLREEAAEATLRELRLDLRYHDPAGPMAVERREILVAELRRRAECRAASR